MSSTPSGVNCDPSAGNCPGANHNTGGGDKPKHRPQPPGREGAQGNFNNRPVTPGTRSSSNDPSTVIPLRVALVWLAIAGAVLVGSIPLVRWGRRRRKLHNAAREPRALILATYDVFSERAADLGFGRGPGETPFEYRRRVEATDVLVDGHLERLTGCVVRAAYGSQTPSDDDALDAAADADQIIHDLRRSTPLRRRLFGIYRRD